MQVQKQMGGKKSIIDKVLLPEQVGKFLTPGGASRGRALGDGVGQKFSIWVAAQNDTQNDTHIAKSRSFGSVWSLWAGRAAELGSCLVGSMFLET